MDFWANHGILFLIFITIFPRITLLVSSVVSGGLLWWLGWIFAPHFLVAILATTSYWDTNPALVVVSWFIAFAGTSGESSGVASYKRRDR